MTMNLRGDSAMCNERGAAVIRGYLMTKRAFDIALSLVGLVVFSPLAGFIAILILAHDGRPIFYRKRSVGRDGVIFDVVKFRSMDECTSSITKVGRRLRQTAMDELPQLITILMGQMSFVGPRPYGIEKYGLSRDSSGRRLALDPGDPRESSFTERLAISPGLTGLAQVFAPKHASDEEVLRWDLEYLRRRSFLLDLYIITLSIWVTLRGGWERLFKKI